MLPAISEKTYTIQATATVNGKEYTQGYDLTTQRYVDQALLYHPAVAGIKGINVKVIPVYVLVCNSTCWYFLFFDTGICSFGNIVASHTCAVGSRLGCSAKDGDRSSTDT